VAHVVEIEVAGGACGGEVHAVGQKWLFDGYTPEGMCLGAFNAIIPYVFTLHCGGAFSWADNPDAVEIRCPHEGGIVLRLTRRPETT